MRIINDKERCFWIINDKDIYDWYCDWSKTNKGGIRKFSRKYKKEIDDQIQSDY